MVGAGRTDSSGVCLDSSTDDKSLRSLDSNETFAKSEKQLNDSSLDNDDIEQTARDADAREDETQRGSSNAERAVGRDSLSSEGKELVSSITTAPPLPGSVYFANGPVYNAAAAERFKMLRAKIERLSASSKRSKYKVIAVASAAPREGKSTVAVNLARAFAEDPLGKTLLIDCDLRNPTVHEFFKLPKYPGVREILEGAPIDGAPIHQVFPRMDVLCAGKEIDNPIQLFLEPEGAKFLRYLRKKYRHIVVDTPPVLLCAEAITLSSLADASLLVVRSGQTKKEMIRSAIETLRKNNILGTVMNDEIVVSRDYGSKQYSKYYT
jgi:protein-tyrosine kinase